VVRFAGLAIAIATLSASPASATECVVLVHGLGRSAASMAPLARSLASLGYAVVAPSYPSTRPIIEASAPVIGEAIAKCQASKASRIHFVTHSLGALVVSRYLQDHEIPEAGRIVMLAPPNNGSEIADHLKDRWWFRRATGPAGQELVTNASRAAADIPMEIGVIAGTRNYEPWFARYFSGPNDGKVSVESTKLAGMTDFVTVHAGHTFMINSPEVAAQTAAFLAGGRFKQS
jgi:pimeloyl-ACP methyl ester carboxylesterase